MPSADRGNMTFHFVVNPAGASGRTGKVFASLQPILKESGQDIRIHYSTREKNIEAVCREVLESAEEKPVNLVIVGGDGSFNEAVNAVSDFSAVRIGLVPAGSGNDLAKSLRLTGSSEELLWTILKGREVRTMDYGEVWFHTMSDRQEPGRSWKPGDVRRFAVSCGIGYDAAICHGVAVSRWKKFLNRIHLGKLIYIFVAIRLIFLTDLAHITLTCDDRTSRFDRLLFAVCMNTQYEGGGFRFCPEADWNDGQMDVCISNPLHSKIVFFKAFPMAYSGAHVKLTEVFWQERGRQIRIHADRQLFVHTDGEVGCRSDDITVRTGCGKMHLLM